MTKKKTINYGIIGFGRYAENRLTPAFSSTKWSQLIAISKRNREQAASKAQQYNVHLYFDDPDIMVKNPEVDAVIITSPPAFHREHTIIAAKAQKHVIVEKPMSINAKEAEEMVQVCDEVGVKLMVAYVMRFIDVIRETKKVIQNDCIGQIFYAGGYFGLDATLTHRDWLNNPQISGGGSVADIGSHIIDLQQYILNKRIIDVKSFIKPLYNMENIEQNAVASLEFEDGILGTMYVSFTVHRQSGLTFHGSKGKLNLQNFNQPDKEVTIELTGNEDKLIKVYNQYYYTKMIDHFSEAILFDKQIETPGHVGVQNQRIIDKIYGN